MRYFPSGGSSDSVLGPASSVDGQIVLFDGTTGKLVKAATGSGVVYTASGVYNTEAALASLRGGFGFDLSTTQEISTGGSLSSITPTAAIIRFTNSGGADMALNGFVPPSGGNYSILFCINDRTGANTNITIVHEQFSITASNRIHLESQAQYVWPKDQMLIFVYDPTDARWKTSVDQVTGTADYVAIYDAAGRISSEQNLAISRGGTNKSSYTDGSVLYYDATDGRIDEDTSNLFYDDTIKAFGVGSGTSLDAGGHFGAALGPGVPTSPTAVVNYSGTGYNAGSTPHAFRFYGKNGSLFSSSFASPTTISNDGLTPSGGMSTPDISGSGFSSGMNTASYHIWPLYDSNGSKGGSLTIDGSWQFSGGDNGTGPTNQGAGNYSPGDTVDYRIYVLYEGDTSYWDGGLISFGGISEGGDSFDIQFEASYTGSGAPSSYIIERQVNGGGFNDYYQSATLSFYDDTTIWTGGPPTLPGPMDYAPSISWTAPSQAIDSIYRIFRDSGGGYNEYYDTSSTSLLDDGISWTAGDEGVDLPATKQYSISLAWANASGVPQMRMLKSDGAGHSFNHYRDYTGTSGTDDNSGFTTPAVVLPNVGYAVHGHGGPSLFEPGSYNVKITKSNLLTTFSDENSYHLLLSNSNGSPRTRIGFEQGGTVRALLFTDTAQAFGFACNTTFKWYGTIASLTSPTATLNATGLFLGGGTDSTASARVHTRGSTPLRFDNSSGTALGGVDSSFNPFFGASGVTTANGSVGRILYLANTSNNNTVLHLQTGTTAQSQGGILEVTGGRTGADARIGQWNVRYLNSSTSDSTGAILMQINNDTASLVDAWNTVGTTTVNALTMFGSSTAAKSVLESAYSFGARYLSVSADTTLTNAHFHVSVDASGAARTITLPAASTATNRIYSIKKIDSSVNTVTIDGNASETIDGATTQVLAAQYDYLMIISTGSAWVII